MPPATPQAPIVPPVQTPPQPQATPVVPAAPATLVPPPPPPAPPQPSAPPVPPPVQVMPKAPARAPHSFTFLYVTIALLIGVFAGGALMYYLSTEGLLWPADSAALEQTIPTADETATQDAASAYTEIETNPLQDIQVNPFE